MRVVETSIIILMHNFAQLTLDCLESIAKNTKKNSYELIVVNNGSKQSQRRLLKNGLSKFDFSKVKIVDATKNLGFAKGANFGAKSASGEYIVFLNNDTIVSKNWLSEMTAFLGGNPQVAACQPKLLSILNQKYFDYAGAAGGFLDIFGYPFARGRVFENVEEDFGQYDKPLEVFWATGACLAIARSKFWKVGGFDENFISYMEEIDLCIRLRKAKFKIYCVPSSLVFHWGAKTSNLDLAKKIFQHHHNHLYLLVKYYSVWSGLPIFFVSIFFDFSSIVFYLWHRQINNAFAVIKAYYVFSREIPDFIKQDVISWQGKSLLSDKKIYKSSVVFRYFFLGQKDFNQLMG